MKCQAIAIQGAEDIHCENTAFFRTEDDVPVCTVCANLFRVQGFTVTKMANVPECNTLDVNDCLECTEHSGTCPGVPS